MPDVARGADLHVHTNLSDGTFAPEEVVRHAVERRLDAVAVTDHDITDGVSLAREAATDGLEIISGVELSASTISCCDDELHLVGLFIDLSHAELQEHLVAWRRQRRERIVEMVRRLNDLGISLRPDEIFEIGGAGAVSRLHVANALVRIGVARTVGGAFQRWIGPGAPAFVRRSRPAAAATIELIHRAGGVAVLAHPGAHVSDDDVASLAAMGLDGVEVFSGYHTPDMERRYAGLARRHGLLVSAGSDCHGMQRGTAAIGSVRLPAEGVEALRRRAAEHAEKYLRG